MYVVNHEALSLFAVNIGDLVHALNILICRDPIVTQRHVRPGWPGALPIDSGVHVSPDDAILVADSGFPQKPALTRHWDLRVYLHVEVADVLHRGTIRDRAFMDSAQAAAERYRAYYIPGEQLYLADAHPAERADIVIDNRNFDAPRIMRGLPDPRYDY